MTTKVTLSKKGKVLKTEQATDNPNDQMVECASVDCRGFFYSNDPSNKLIGLRPLAIRILRAVQEKSEDISYVICSVSPRGDCTQLYDVRNLTDLMWTLESKGYLNLQTSKIADVKEYYIHRTKVSLTHRGNDVLLGVDSANLVGLEVL